MVAFIAGCAQPAGPKPETLLQDYERAGYAPHVKLATTSVRDVWTNPDGTEKIDIRLIGPTPSGRYPVVVYLPGLGETVDDGAVWCDTWAASGYVVVVVQPQRDGSIVWQSTEARLAEFDKLAAVHFAPESMHRRLVDAEFAIGQARSRAARGDPILRDANFERAAVAGFDLGAQTSLDLAGAAGRHSGGAAVGSAIALSPYATAGTAGADQDWSRIGLPVLTVTGTQDLDPYGLVPTATLRQSVFQALPAGEKYLLVLAGGSHDTLSGDIPAGETATRGSSAARRRSQAASSQGGNTSKASGRGRSNDTGDATQPDGTVSAADRREEAASIRAAEVRTQMRQMALVESVTTAFLDMTLKDDAAARRWLAQDVQRYSGPLAHLQTK